MPLILNTPRLLQLFDAVHSFVSPEHLLTKVEFYQSYVATRPCPDLCSTGD